MNAKNQRMTILALDPGNAQTGYAIIETPEFKENQQIRTDKKYCVYMHTNTANSKKYIGFTCQKVNSRWRGGKGYRDNPRFYEAILKYGWDSFKHDILFNELSFCEAEQKEIELIAFYRSNEPEFGYNMLSGGVTHFTMDDDTKHKISNSLKGRCFTDEHKRKKSLAQTGSKNHRYGKHWSEEDKERIRQINISHPSKGQIPSRKINQYDLNGNYIKTWNSMGEIKRELGISHCTISDCCRGKQSTSGGFIWKYCQ